MPALIVIAAAAAVAAAVLRNANIRARVRANLWRDLPSADERERELRPGGREGDRPAAGRAGGDRAPVAVARPAA